MFARVRSARLLALHVVLNGTNQGAAQSNTAAHIQPASKLHMRADFEPCMNCRSNCVNVRAAAGQVRHMHKLDHVWLTLTGLIASLAVNALHAAYVHVAVKLMFSLCNTSVNPTHLHCCDACTQGPTAAGSTGRREVLLGTAAAAAAAAANQLLYPQPARAEFSSVIDNDEEPSPAPSAAVQQAAPAQQSIKGTSYVVTPVRVSSSPCIMTTCSRHGHVVCMNACIHMGL